MEKVNDVRGFRNYRMNLDVSPELFGPNDVGEVYNMLEENRSGKITNMRGFESVFALPINSGFVLPTGAVFKCIGSCQDIEESTILYCLCDTVGTNHSILQMNTETKLLQWVLKAEPLLNFKAGYRIRRGSIIDGLFYFNDGYEGTPFIDYNPPRKINIVKAMGLTNPYSPTKLYKPGEYAGYNGKVYQYIYPTTSTVNISPTYTIYWKVANIGIYSAITRQILDRIKYPPTADLVVFYGSDPDIQHNNLRGRLFQFRYRYTYDDNEKSTWSSISDMPFPEGDELLNGNYISTSAIQGGIYSGNVVNNKIDVFYDSSSSEVVKIEIAAREGNSKNWKIVKEVDKFDKNGTRLINDNTSYQFAFYNDTTTIPVDESDIERLYDFVPQISKTQELIEKNRIIDGDYIEGYDDDDINISLALETKPRIDFDSLIVSYPGVFATGDPYGFSHINITFPSGMPRDVSVMIRIFRYTWFYLGDPTPVYGDTSNSELCTVEYFLSNEDTIENMVSQLRYLVNKYIAAQILNPVNSQPEVIAVPNSNQSILTLKFQSFYNFIGYYPGGIIAADYYLITFAEAVVLQPITRYQTFKSGAWHFFGIEYFDRAMRSGGVNKNENSKIFIPYLTERYGGGGALLKGRLIIDRSNIGWSIYHKPPIWAKYWRWLYGKSNIEWFLQVNVKASMIYDDGDNTIIEINRNIVLTKANYKNFIIESYVWEKGDRVRFLSRQLVDTINTSYVYFDVLMDYEILGSTYSTTLTPVSNDFYLRDQSSNQDFVLDSDGNKREDTGYLKILIPKLNKAQHFIPTSPSANNMIVVEIYRPKKENTVISDYYEVDAIRNVINPHTETRAHSAGYGPMAKNQQWLPSGSLKTAASGEFQFGDCFIKQRVMVGTFFGVEALEYSDYFDSSYKSFGRINVNFGMTRRRYFSKVIYSELYIQNTRINGLSTVLSSHSIELAEKHGAINHIEEVGYTLKILQKSKPSSLLIGRAGVTQPTEQGTEILSSTKDVLGTLYVHNSDFGTVHPDSYVKNENRGYFFDFYAHALCRDANNGIQNISEAYGIDSFLQEKCRLFGSADNVDVIGAFDQANEMVFWTFIDKTTTANSFTIAFKDSGGENEDGFKGFYEFQPDYFGYAKQTLTSFKGNTLWLHNSDTAPRANFYGVQKKYWVTVVFNKLPLIIKRWLRIFVASDKKFSAPDAGDISIPPTGNNPGGMVSLLKAGAFDSIQGKYIAELGKNMTTNQTTAEIADLVNGDDLEGQTISIRMEGEETTEHKLLSVEIEGVTTKP